MSRGAPQSSSSSSSSGGNSSMSAAAQQQIAAGLAAAAAAAAKYGESLHRSSQQSAALAQMQQLGSFAAQSQSARGGGGPPQLHSAQSSPALDSLYHFAGGGSHHEQSGTGPPYYGGGGGRKPSLISGYHNPSMGSQSNGGGGGGGPNLSGAINPLSLPGGAAFYSSMMGGNVGGLSDEIFGGGKGNKQQSSSSSSMKQLNSSSTPSRSSQPQQQQQQSTSNPNAAAQMTPYAATLTQPLIGAATTGLALKGIGPNHPQYQLFLQDEIQQLKHKDPQQLYQLQMQREKQLYSQLQLQQQQQQQQQQHQRPSPLINSSASSHSEIAVAKKEPTVAPQPHHQNQHHHHHHHSSLIGSHQNAMASASSSSSSYVPQVEAISPTPEDQRENSNLQAIKDKIITEIYKVEKDFASTQYQLEMIKKKQTELAELQSRQMATSQSSSQAAAVSLPAPETTMTLAEKIYQENRKKADESHRQVLKPMQQNSATATSTVHTSVPLDAGKTVPDANSIEDCIPFYHEFSDSKQYYDMRAHYEQHLRPRLIQIIKRQSQLRRQKERSMADKYDEMHAVWHKKCDRFENSVRKKQKDAKYRELFEKIFPELRKQREERERLLQKQRAAADPTVAAAAAANLAATGAAAVATKPGDPVPVPVATAAESQSTAAADASELTALEDERRRVLHLAVVPPLCLDARQRRYKFVNTNGYVADPVGLFKAAKNEVYWTEREKEIFLEKLLTFGKNFEIISTYLEKKRVQDCIEYYYLTKKKVNYKMLIRKHQRKRKRDVKSTAGGGGGGGGGGGAGASGGSGSSNSNNNSNNSSASTNQQTGSSSAISGSNINSANSVNNTHSIGKNNRGLISREALREILRRLTETTETLSVARQPLLEQASNRNSAVFLADMLRQLANPRPDQTTIIVATASVDNSPAGSSENSNGGGDKSPAPRSSDNSNDAAPTTLEPANTAPSPDNEENSTPNEVQLNAEKANRDDNSPRTNDTASGASTNSNEALPPPPPPSSHPPAISRGQIVDFINDAIKNALNTDIELPASTVPAVKSPPTTAVVAESTTIRNNESIVVVNKPLSSTHVNSRDEEADHDDEYPRIDPTMKVASSISYVVDHLTRGADSPRSSPSVSPQPPPPAGQARKKDSTEPLAASVSAPKTAFSHITDLISKELKAADPMPPPPAPSTSTNELTAKTAASEVAPTTETIAMLPNSTGCTLGTWVDTLISKRMYDDIAATSPPPGRSAKMTTATMMQANANATVAMPADQLFDIHAANRMKSNFSSDMSHYARLKAQSGASALAAQSDQRSTPDGAPVQNEHALKTALKTASERAPSASGSSSVSSPSSSLSVSPNNAANNEAPHSVTGRRPSDYDAGQAGQASPPEAKKSKLNADEQQAEGGVSSSKIRKVGEAQGAASEEGPAEQPFLVRSRKSSLTMKILQGTNEHHEPPSAGSSSTTTPRPAENVWNSMLGGLIKKSLEEELPPPLNISDLHSSVPRVPAPPSLLPSPKGSSSDGVAKRTSVAPPLSAADDNVVDITEDHSVAAPTPQQQAALAAIAAVSGIHTKDLIMQARSYGQQVQSAKSSAPSRMPAAGMNLQASPLNHAHRLAMEQIVSAGLNAQQQQQLISYLSAAQNGGMRFGNQPGGASGNPAMLMSNAQAGGGNPMDLLIRKQIAELEQQQQRSGGGPGRQHPSMMPPQRPVAAAYSPRNANAMAASPSPPATASSSSSSYSPAGGASKPPLGVVGGGGGGLSPNLMQAIMSATTAALAGSPSMSPALIERTAAAVAAAAAAYMSSPLFGGGGGGDAGMLDPLVLQQIIHAVCSTTNLASLSSEPMLPKLKTSQLPPSSSANSYTRGELAAGAHAYLQQQQQQHLLHQQQLQQQAHHQSPGLHPSYLLQSPTQSGRLAKSPHQSPYASLAESMLADPATAQALLANHHHHHQQQQQQQQRMNAMSSSSSSSSSPLVVQQGLKNPTNSPSSTSAMSQSASSAPQQSFKKRLLSSLEATTTTQQSPPPPPPMSASSSAPNYALNKLMANNALAKAQYEYLSDPDQ